MPFSRLISRETHHCGNIDILKRFNSIQSIVHGNFFGHDFSREDNFDGNRTRDNSPKGSDDRHLFVSRIREVLRVNDQIDLLEPSTYTFQSDMRAFPQRHISENLCGKLRAIITSDQLSAFLLNGQIE